MEKYKVSVIIPAYNCENFLAQTLDSVLAQTYTNWECIIVDDGSTDGTLSIARDFALSDSRILCFHQENKGPSAARNEAILHSSGDFILPLDADDIILPSYIEKAISHFKAFPETKLVYSKAEYFGVQNGIWNLPSYSFPTLLFRNCIFCSAMYRRSDYDATSGYNESMRAGLEDWDFWIALLNPDDIVHCIDEFLFRYRTHFTSRSSNADNQFANLYKQICTSHEEKFKPYLPDVLYQFQDCLQTFSARILATESALKKIESSMDYKVGKSLLKPFLAIKKMIHCKN